MSTFTNILQKKVNNLEAQIRQLQEQNYNLRRKARWLTEAASESPSQSPGSPGQVYDDSQQPNYSPAPYGGDVDNRLLYVPSGPWQNDPLFRWSQTQGIFNDINLYLWWLNARYEFYRQNGSWPPPNWPPINRYYSN